MPKGRRFSFAGTETAYIKFLEAKVDSLEKEVESFRHHQSSKPRSRKTIVSAPKRPYQAQKQTSDRSTSSLEKRIFSTRLDEHVHTFLKPITMLNSQNKQTTLLPAPEQALKTFQVLTRLSCPVGPTTITPRSSSSLRITDILNDYFNFASRLKHGAEQQARISNFATLLFLGICCVSREAKVPVHDVDDSIRSYFAKPTYSTSYCKRLRAAAKWCAQLMGKLEIAVGCRGPELLLQYGPDIALYQKLAESPRCSDSIVEKITENLKSLRNDDNQYVSFSMPFMLAFLGLDLQCANKALGTDLSIEEYTSRAITVEKMTGHNNGRQQCVPSPGTSYEPDRMAVLTRATQSNTDDTPEFITESERVGDSIAWEEWVDWTRSTSGIDSSLTESPSVRAL
ncbi:hypothetical protein F5B17DRAFT_225514 [Nemania serpens]|nr:hypothetical protein F5B17DRAFT_225514 [Nemania serpens]